MRKSLKWVIVLLFFTMAAAYAKRMPASIAPDVFYHGVKYQAAYDHGGIIKAYSAKSDQFLWKKRIYRVSYDPHLEKDVQDVFITNMKIKRGHLVIKDEKNRKYLLNLKS